ncbi:hypothetical protein ScPMuIL_009910 [Solemya velum]
MSNFLNSKVRIRLVDTGEYLDGFVSNVNRSSKRLSLERVTTKEGTLPGLQHFYGHELSDITILQAGKPAPQQQNRNERGQRLLKTKQIPPHLRRMKEFDQEPFLLKNVGTKDSVKSSDYESSSDHSDVEVQDPDGKFVVLTKFNELFYKSIKYISSQDIIAVGFDGVSIGRNGDLCWVEVATRDDIFLFDIIKLGDKAFEDGLKEILESETIQKVFHDCRLPSDLLEHKHGIRIVNVFDTQVAAVLIYRLLHHGDWPRYVPGLASCLLENLELSPDSINRLRVRNNSKKEDQAVWAKRPAKPQILEAASRNVMYLIDLRSVLMERMLTEFVAGVDIFLQHVRDASKDDALIYQSSPHLLPVAFQQLPHIVSSQEKMYGHRTERSSGYHVPGRELIVVRDLDLVCSKDSIWKSGIDNPEYLHKRRGTGRMPGFRVRGDSEPKKEKVRVSFTEAASNVGTLSDKENESPQLDEIVEHCDESLNIPIKTSTPEKSWDDIVSSIDNSQLTIEKNLKIEDESGFSDEKGDCSPEEGERENDMTPGNETPQFKSIRELLQHNAPSPNSQQDILEHFSLVPAGTNMGYRKRPENLEKTKKPTHRRSEGAYTSSELNEHRREPRRYSSEYYKESHHPSKYENKNETLINKKSFTDTEEANETEKPQRSVIIHKKKTQEIENDFDAEYSDPKQSELSVNMKGDAFLNSSSDSSSSLHENLMEILNKHEKTTPKKHEKGDLAITSVKESTLYLENAAPIGTHIRVQSHKVDGFSSINGTIASPKEQSGFSDPVSKSAVWSNKSPSSSSLTQAVSGPKSVNFESSLLGNLTTSRSSEEDMVYENNFSSSTPEETPETSFTGLDTSNTSPRQPKSPGDSGLLKGLFDALGMNN